MDSITSKLGVEAQNYHSVNLLNHFKHEILLAQGLSHYFNGRKMEVIHYQTEAERPTRARTVTESFCKTY